MNLCIFIEVLSVIVCLMVCLSIGIMSEVSDCFLWSLRVICMWVIELCSVGNVD